jgi:threonine/homoserine/homoserine lactone efflux protein
MNPLLKIFLISLLISFLGSLPLGTMNIMATNLAMRDGFSAAFFFSAGSVLVEVGYVRIALIAMNWISRQRKLFRFFEWLTILLLLALAIGSFSAAIRMSGFGTALPGVVSHPFLLGILLSGVNPMHISFWFGWSTILTDRHILLPCSTHYNAYITGIGIGSLMGFGVFIFGGNYLITQLHLNQHILNWIIGVVLLITAFIQGYRMLNKPSRLILQHV